MIKYPYSVNYAEIGNDIKIAYCDEGKGPKTLLFVHGLANYLPVFKHNIDFLKQHFRCIAIDLPGNGLSSRGNYPFSMFFYAETLYRFIQKMELNNVVLVGHSMGGQVSIIMTLRYPHVVSKLVLLASSGLEYFNDMEKSLVKNMMSIGSFMYSDGMSLESAISSSYYHERKLDAIHIIKELKFLMSGEEGRYWKKMVKANIEAMLDEQVSKFLTEIQAPTLLLFGKQDALIPNKMVHFNESTETLAKKSGGLIPQCEVHLINHCGHFIQIEASQKVNQFVFDFIS